MKPIMVARTSMLRMQSMLALVMLPHLPRMPAWTIAFMLCLFGWRIIATWKAWPIPPRWARACLTILTFVGIQYSYGTVSGQNAGVALLLVLMTLKLTETGPKRDNCVLTFLAYFVLATHFLFSQHMLMVIFLLAAAILITAVLMDLNHPQGPLPTRYLLKSSGKMIATALPIMLLFFFLFPRIPGPIWGIPSDTGAAKSGLSDELSPGDISSLSMSDEVAFRVRFDGDIPTPEQRYWRGPVLSSYNGRKWTIGDDKQLRYAASARLTGANTFSYEVIIEPTRRRWLYALDIPLQSPSGSKFDRNMRLVRWKPLIKQKIYSVTSNPEYVLEEQLPPYIRQLNLELPAGFDPKTRALAKRWRVEGLTPDEMISRILNKFRTEPYTYTLQPPLLGKHAIDEFLFGTRRGFCAHFAGSFVFLLRAAGIPARLVTGFQGMTEGISGNYQIVRNSDAHAWAEVWLENRGWVRVDPTGAVAPERIELGIGGALSQDEPLPSLARSSLDWISGMRMRWDWMNAQWDRWVLGYGPELQHKVMQWLGLTNWTLVVLILTFGTLGILALSTVVHIVRLRPQRSKDPLVRLWRQFDRRIKKHGIVRAANEGPLDIAARVQEQCPEIAAQVRHAATLYSDLRYLDNAQDLNELKAAIQNIP